MDVIPPVTKDNKKKFFEHINKLNKTKINSFLAKENDEASINKKNLLSTMRSNKFKSDDILLPSIKTRTHNQNNTPKHNSSLNTSIKIKKTNLEPIKQLHNASISSKSFYNASSGSIKE